MSRRSLSIVLGLVVVYMGAEVVGGILSNSLALMADAGHMLSDAASLALSLFAIWVAGRESSVQHTYGLYRAEILAALANGAALVAISIFIFLEAWTRFQNPPEVDAPWMMGIAVGGLVVNLIGLYVLHGSKDESLNIKGAWLHVMADTLGSVGTIAAGSLIWIFGWNIADPIISVVIGVLVIYSSWTLLRSSVNVLMEGAPGHIDVDEVRRAILSVPGVDATHDLHIWTITSGMVALSVHVVCTNQEQDYDLLFEIRKVLHDEFGIDHMTVQLEPPEFEEHLPAF